MPMALKEIDWDSKFSNDDYDPTGKTITQQLVELDNAKKGNLTGFDCQICLNKGFVSIYVAETDSSKIDDCECMKVRKSKKIAEQSNMGELLAHRLRDFKVTEPFQEVMRDKVKDYILNARTEWFLALGQSGCGKTMICSSICNERMTHYDENSRKYTQVKYMIWNDYVEQMNRLRFDYDRDNYFFDFAKAELLYIDDLFKGRHTDNDVKLAFDLINYRYNNNLPTIISSEMTIDKIRDLDEALAGRMFQKATERFTVQVGKDETKNYRFKGLVTL